MRVSRADQQLLHSEARAVIKAALGSYEGSDVHLSIFALRTELSWNDLQTILGRSDHPSDPTQVRTICTAVEEHIELELRSYLEIGPRT